MLLKPRAGYDRNHLGAMVYTRLIVGQAVKAPDIRDIADEARQAYEGEIQGRIAFVVVDRTPETNARASQPLSRGERSLCRE